MNSDGVPPEARLAAAVIYRAILDLSTTKEKDCQSIRQDAYDFLVHRLWEGDHEDDHINIWRAVFGHELDRDVVLSVVDQRCVLLPNGKIKPRERVNE